MHKSYKINNGCWNCFHSFVHVEYDEGNQFYCEQDGSQRPICGSTCMNESFGGELKKMGISWKDKKLYYRVFSKLMNKWYRWSEKHSVAESGICDKYKLKRRNGIVDGNVIEVRFLEGEEE